MTVAFMVSIMGVLTVVAIYYWWARKMDTEAPGKE